MKNRTYTVSELIEVLSRYPGDWKVNSAGSDSGGYDAIMSDHMVVGSAEEINQHNHDATLALGMRLYPHQAAEHERWADYNLTNGRKPGTVWILGLEADRDIKEETV